MIENIITSLLANEAFVAALLGWFCAQSLKTVIDLWRFEKWDWERMVGSGGFPSSHTALVVALTSAIAFHEGLDSTLFAVSAVYAAIVMYDASGVRRAAGKQAKILNQIVQHHKANKTLKEEVPLLKELLGHTPFEVFGGAILGFVVALLLYLY